MMSIGWNFPSNNYGKITGISEAGIETFRGSLFQSLAREICQNSLDARKNIDKPVYIEFMLSEINKDNIDCFDELYKAITLCREFWKDNEKTVNFFDQAIKVCRNDAIRVLRISDFNTTGLPGSKKYKSSPWQNLVKSSGVSDKNGVSGGSYGIGKSAPFACSDLRTVYYSTLDNEGIRAYQGVANLVSFKSEDKFLKKGEVTQGTGYYGEKTTNSAVESILSMDGFVRNECGTDIYVLGFIKSDDWKDEIIKAILDGYLISILKKDIKVKVEDIIINDENLPKLIEHYKEELPLTYNYYQVLSSKETVHITENFENLGNLSLYVLIHKDFRRKVLMSRSNGMKIFDKQNISGTIQFAGVCILEDENLNSYFREMETPQHNDWEPDRHSDRKKAKRMKTALFKFIKDKILEIGKETISDEMDAIGGGEIIPDFNMENASQNSVNEYIANEVKEFTIQKVDKAKIDKGTQFLDNSNTNSTEESYGVEDENGDFLSDKYIHGDGTRRGGTKDEKEGEAALDADGNLIIDKTITIRPLKMRLFMNDAKQKSYKLTFLPEKSAKNAYVEILMAGEQSNTKATIKKAIMDDEELLCKQNRIYIGNIEKNKSYSTIFTLKYDEVCSMGVLVHGYKI